MYFWWFLWYLHVSPFQTDTHILWTLFQTGITPSEKWENIVVDMQNLQILSGASLQPASRGNGPLTHVGNVAKDLVTLWFTQTNNVISKTVQITDAMIDQNAITTVDESANENIPENISNFQSHIFQILNRRIGKGFQPVRMTSLAVVDADINRARQAFPRAQIRTLLKP